MSIRVEVIDEPRIALEVFGSTAAKILGLLYLADWDNHPDVQELAEALALVVEEDAVESDEPVTIRFESEEE